MLWFGSSPNYGVYGDLALLRHQGLHYFVFQLFDMVDGRVRRITVARQIYIVDKPGPTGTDLAAGLTCGGGKISRDLRWIYIETTVGFKPSPVYEAADDGG
jgi:hypothetical protein